jgi:hypothetical protein
MDTGQHLADLYERQCEAFEEHQKQIEEFKFNQQANFLFHFVNRFKVVSIEDVRENLKQIKK